nr:CASP-like protein 4A1 [Penaeus vannamei]
MIIDASVHTMYLTVIVQRRGPEASSAPEGAAPPGEAQVAAGPEPSAAPPASGSLHLSRRGKHPSTFSRAVKRLHLYWVWLPAQRGGAGACAGAMEAPHLSEALATLVAEPFACPDPRPDGSLRGGERNFVGAAPAGGGGRGASDRSERRGVASWAAPGHTRTWPPRPRAAATPRRRRWAGDAPPPPSWPPSPPSPPAALTRRDVRQPRQPLSQCKQGPSVSGTSTRQPAPPLTPLLLSLDGTSSPARPPARTRSRPHAALGAVLLAARRPQQQQQHPPGAPHLRLLLGHGAPPASSSSSSSRTLARDSGLASGRLRLRSCARTRGKG